MSGCVSLGATAIMLAVIYFMVRAFTATGKTGNGAPSSWSPTAAGGTQSWGTDPQTGREITVQVKGDSTWKWASIQVPMAKSMPTGLVIGVRPTPQLPLSHGERGERAFYALVDAVGKNPRFIETWAIPENQNAVLDAYWRLEQGFQVRGNTISTNLPVAGEGDPQIQKAVYILAELAQRLTAVTASPQPPHTADEEVAHSLEHRQARDRSLGSPMGEERHDLPPLAGAQAGKTAQAGSEKEPSEASGASLGLGAAALAFPGKTPGSSSDSNAPHPPVSATPSPFASGSGSPGQSPSPFTAGSGSPGQSPSPFASGSGSPGQSPSPFASGSGSPGQSPSPFAAGTPSPGDAPSPAASDASQAEKDSAHQGREEATGAHGEGAGEGVSSILATVVREGSTDAQERLVAERWAGHVVTGEGKASFSSQIFGRDTELEVTGGTKVTVEVTVEGGGVLAPKVVLHLEKPPEPGALGFGKVVRFEGEVKSYRGLSRNLLLVNGRIL